MSYKTVLFFVIGLTAVFTLSSWYTPHIAAHGANIEYSIDTTIYINANFDDGTPMSQCQYTIYAPNAPNIAWDIGECNTDGQFSFIPDLTQNGDWAINVREAGHGEIITIPIENASVGTTTQTNSTSQKIITGLATIWGFVGTALYFSKRN